MGAVGYEMLVAMSLSQLEKEESYVYYNSLGTACYRLK